MAETASFGPLARVVGIHPTLETQCLVGEHWPHQNHRARTDNVMESDTHVSHAREREGTHGPACRLTEHNALSHAGRCGEEVQVELMSVT